MRYDFLEDILVNFDVLMVGPAPVVGNAEICAGGVGRKRHAK